MYCKVKLDKKCIEIKIQKYILNSCWYYEKAFENEENISWVTDIEGGT